MLVLMLAGACSPSSPPTGEVTPTSTWRAQAFRSLEAGQYALRPDGEGLRATNRAHGLALRFGRDGLTVRPREGGDAEVRIVLAAWGREGAVEDAEPAAPEEGDCQSGSEVDAFGECLRRAHLPRPGLLEWWENRRGGLEQGFTVTAPPDGAGALVFDLAVAGAAVEVDGDAVLSAEGGLRLRYGKLRAWDEAGRELPSWMEATDTGLRLVVDDDGAVGTVTVDPLLTAEHWSAASGQAGAWLGASVSWAGDVDGDGYGDVVVGAPYWDGTDSEQGAAWLYLGSASGLSSTAAWSAEGTMAYAYLGRAVAGAGDVNGDGYGDVIVGSPGFGDAYTEPGTAELYLGSASGLSTTAAWTVSGSAAGDQFGTAVAAAGDVNGDGYADVVVGAPYYSNGATDEGSAFVYLGSAAGPSTTAGWSADGGATSAEYGTSVAGAGDVNGDGYADVIVGARRATDGEADEGAATLYHGSASGLATAAAVTLQADDPGAYFGTSVSAAGDVNGDGYADVIVGAPAYTGSVMSSGAAFVYYGSSAGIATTASWTVQGAHAVGEFGRSVAGAGDVNGDGYADLLIGAPYEDNTSAEDGSVYLHLGGASGPATDPAWSVAGSHAQNYVGYSVAAAGDVDGDGLGDVITGAIGHTDTASAEGSATVYLGEAGGLPDSAGWTAAGGQASARLGVSLASAGDVNGDGYDDLVVGALLYDDGESNEGAAFLYLGGGSGLSSSAAWSAQGDQANAYFGHHVATAGDVNGDGYADVAVSASGYDEGQTNEGKVWVYHGSSGGLATTAAWSFASDGATGFLGPITAAGDVNGDGYGDLLSAAPQHSGSATYGGGAWLHFGSSAGLSSTAGWSYAGTDPYDFLGVATTACDFNGDGYGDIVLFTNSATIAPSRSGAGIVFHGGPTGPASTYDLAVVGTEAEEAFAQSLTAADVHGDGYCDLIVGASYYDGSRGTGADAGRVYVYSGSATGLGSTPATLEGDQNGAHFGGALVSAGDIDADGDAELWIASPDHDGDAADAGQVDLFLGSSSGPEGTASWSVSGEEASAALGDGLADAGDYNGDGYPDLALGAPTADGASTDEGEVRVYYGNSGDGQLPLALAPQARQVGADQPIVPGLPSSAEEEFAVALLSARSPRGTAQVALEVEARPLGTAFDGSSTTTTGYTSTGTTAASLQATVSGLDAGTGYHWRARLRHDATDGAPLQPGRWVYGGIPGEAALGHVFTAGGTDVATDDDGDGYGDESDALTLRTGASTPSGYVADATDCDDGDDTVNPGATEVCDDDDVDEDCDGLAESRDDSVTGEVSGWADDDEDGYGQAGGTETVSCDHVGRATNDDDCDDGDATVNPAATEVCDAADVDEDCDGLADDDDPGATGTSTFYVDADGDGHGGSTTTEACDAASGREATSDDCDDADAAVSPDATEACDDADVDEDCDGLADDDDPSVTGTTTTWVDDDEDGYGVAGEAGVERCDVAAYATNDEDCDDGDAAVSPAATEVCDDDDVDEDCDGDADDADASATGQSTWYLDADGDGHAGGTSVTACDADADEHAASDDCDDADPHVNPRGTEVCDDLDVDEDCDGAADDADADVTGTTSWFADEDGDGHGSTTSTAACAAPVGYVGNADDCDDADAAVSPDGAEVCDAADVDEDCDGVADDEDESATGQTDWFTDADGDGYGDVALGAFCEAPTAASANDGDCDDAAAAFHPGAEEADCEDPADYNCDGSVGYADIDADGFAACAECDDALAAVNPDATEVCNLVDDDCDGTVDGPASADATEWYADADGDGATDPTDSRRDCTPPPGYAPASAAPDCDDGDPAAHPGAEDVPDNGVDEDCDGSDATAPDTGDTADTADTGEVDEPGVPDTGDPDPPAECGCDTAPPRALTASGLMLLALGVWRRRGARAR